MREHKSVSNRRGIWASIPVFGRLASAHSAAAICVTEPFHLA